mgnify:CR=1 FL=1
MSADYYFFAPTGGRYQTVFRGTLPRRTASGVRNVAIARRFFFVGHCRGDTASGVRGGAIPRPTTFHTPPLRRFPSFIYAVVPLTI